MSLRSNGSGDNLVFTGSWGVTTGLFNIGFWVFIVNDRNTFSDFVSFGATAADPTEYISIGTQTDGTSLTTYDTGGEVFSGNPAELTSATWYWVDIGRDGSNQIIMRVFDDSTSTTPAQTDSVSPFTVDYTNMDNIVIGQIFSGEWADAEFTNVKVHNGVYWTSAESRTESQLFNIQTSGGTKWGAWGLETVAHSTHGLQDLTGNSRTLTNNGFVDGSFRPTQLEAVGGGGAVRKAGRLPLIGVGHGAPR